MGSPVWGSNAQQGLIRREFWGLGSILALTGSGCSLGKISQLWMTARAYLSDEKIGSAKCGVLSLFQMFFVRKTMPRTRSKGKVPIIFQEFSTWQSLVAAVTLTAFDSRGSRPSGPLRRSMGKIHARLGPFESKGLSLRCFCFCGKTSILRPSLCSLMIDWVTSRRVDVHMFPSTSHF